MRRAASPRRPDRATQPCPCVPRPSSPPLNPIISADTPVRRGIGSILYTDQSTHPDGGQWEGFLYNAVGHTTVVTDSAGSPTQASVYEAFGQTLYQTGTSRNNRLANTKERDATIALDNHGFRYDDPPAGEPARRCKDGSALNRAEAEVGNWVRRSFAIRSWRRLRTFTDSSPIVWRCFDTFALVTT